MNVKTELDLMEGIRAKASEIPKRTPKIIVPLAWSQAINPGEASATTGAALGTATCARARLEKSRTGKSFPIKSSML